MTTAGKNAKATEAYIRKQLQKDIKSDKLTAKEYIDPFKEYKPQKEKQKRRSKRKSPSGLVSKTDAIGGLFNTP